MIFWVLQFPSIDLSLNLQITFLVGPCYSSHTLTFRLHRRAPLSLSLSLLHEMDVPKDYMTTLLDHGLFASAQMLVISYNLLRVLLNRIYCVNYPYSLWCSNFTAAQMFVIYCYNFSVLICCGAMIIILFLWWLKFIVFDICYHLLSFVFLHYFIVVTVFFFSMPSIAFFLKINWPVFSAVIFTFQNYFDLLHLRRGSFGNSLFTSTR